MSPTAQMRKIRSNRSFTDFGLHGLSRVTVCGVTGMMAVALAVTRAAKAPVARAVQAVLDVARFLILSVGNSCVNAEEAKKKGGMCFEATA